MDLAGYVINAVLVEGRSVKEVCEAHDISRSWLYELIARYLQLGDDGLKPQSKRPRSSPTRVPPAIEDEIIALRKELSRRGFVVHQPHKRPKSSWRRFAAELPNQCWQADTTHWTLADGCDVEILNMIDDHSRLLVAPRALVTAKAADVVETFHQGAW